MVLRGRDAVELAVAGWPAYLRQRDLVERVDLWGRGRQAEIEENPRDEFQTAGGVFMPDGRGSTAEYWDLASRSPTPWAALVVNALTQTMFVDGVFAAGSSEPIRAWQTWQENGWDSKQIPLYRAAITHGIAYAVCLPGVSSLTREPTAIMRPVSARKMSAFYDEDYDDYPHHALEATRQGVDKRGNPVWFVKLYDEEATYYLELNGMGLDKDDWTFISYDLHGLGFTPVVRYSNQIDLDGRTQGEIEPVIPLLRRIDQSTFDRLIVQRFGAWKIRYATGLAKPETAEGRVAEAIRLKMEDLLINSSPDGKFGTLDATEIEGFIKAHEADLRSLSAVTQTPPHHMLGLSSNMQAESLAAVEAGLQRKSFERKTNIGESHELLLRTAAFVRGDTEEARAFDMQVRWRDMESRSLSQAADALGKLAQQVEVPVEMLWERIPGWTDNDTTRAKSLIESGGVDRILDELSRQLAPNDNVTPPPVPGDDAIL